MERNEIIKIMENLLILPNSQLFETLEEYYIELVKNLTPDELKKVVKEVILNEEVFPLPKKFDYYVKKIISQRIKEEYTIYYCDNENCNRLVALPSNVKLNKGLKCPHCKKGKLTKN